MPPKEPPKKGLASLSDFKGGGAGGGGAGGGGGGGGGDGNDRYVGSGQVRAAARTCRPRAPADTRH